MNKNDRKLITMKTKHNMGIILKLVIFYQKVYNKVLEKLRKPGVI